MPGCQKQSISGPLVLWGEREVLKVPRGGKSMPGAITQERMVSDEILSAIEVARELRCSKAHVYNVILGRVGGVSALPAIIMGRRRLVRRSALEAWKRVNEQNAIVSSTLELDR